MLNGKVIILQTKKDRIVFYSRWPHEQYEITDILREYFRLSFDLKLLYKEWAAHDHHFRQVAGKYRAIRLLNQDSYEALLSFICSQNNGIARITKMVRILKEQYGERIATLDGSIDLFAFPSPTCLCGADVSGDLRKRGFGYRAPYVGNVSQSIVDGTLDLKSLRMMPYKDAWSKLLQIKGIGPKVADCVALTGLGQVDAVPIDTHLWQIAKSHYPNMPRTATLTLSAYCAIGDRFRNIFGPMAGWAHLILFAAQIRKKQK